MYKLSTNDYSSQARCVRFWEDSLHAPDLSRPGQQWQVLAAETQGMRKHHFKIYNKHLYVKNTSNNLLFHALLQVTKLKASQSEAQTIHELHPY